MGRGTEHSRIEELRLQREVHQTRKSRAPPILTCIWLHSTSALTAIGNDYGYEHVFEKQIEWLGRPGDMLVAISSSGRSPNILKGVEAARARKAEVLTLSGFEPDNPLRRMGDINLYLPSKQYGFVEAGHLALLSAVVDFAMGWKE